MNDVKKNFIYNIVYQLLILIIPLITMPYISRILGSEGIGAYSYTYSIIYYFMIFAMLGLNNYGNRSIAKIRDDKEKLSITFKEIHLLQIITTLLMIIIYIIFMIVVSNKYKFILTLQSLYLISCMFDINWFFFGIERFKLTVTRNTIIKILSLLLIFLIVRDKNDVWKYTLILSGSTLLSQLLLWPFVKKYTIPVRIRLIDTKKHWLPCLKLFLPVIAVTIYKVMDKTMIGIFSNVSEVGFYENAEKIINVPNSIITALGTVMLPRMSNLYSKDNNEHETKKVIEKSMYIIMFLSIAMCFGLISISKNFSVLFFGEEFVKTGIIITYLSITLIFLSWGNVIRTQYLIPKEKDKEYIVSAFLGAIINLIMNIIFIPKLQSVGACIGTITAEFMVMFYQTYAVRKELPIKNYIKGIIPFFIKAIIMLICIYPFNYIEMNSFLRIIIQVIIGGSVYCLLNIKYILSIINLKKILNKFKKKNTTSQYVATDIDNDGTDDLIPVTRNNNLDNIKDLSYNIEKENNKIDDDINLIVEEVLDKNNISQYNTKEELINSIRKDNNYIKDIDFNKKYDFDIVELILEETKIYNFKFNNNNFLRNNKYPTTLSNSYKFMRYVIDQDINNLAYIDISNIDNNSLKKIIDYTFRKVYYLQKEGHNITFDLNGVFNNSAIIHNEYFKECLKYIKK